MIVFANLVFVIILFSLFFFASPSRKILEPNEILAISSLYKERFPKVLYERHIGVFTLSSKVVYSKSLKVYNVPIVFPSMHRDWSGYT